MLERLFESTFVKAAKISAVGVNVFTSPSGIGGNPAAVILSDEILPRQSMQECARRASFPVSVFIHQQTSPPTVRFFSPERELPMCGHGSLAASFVLSDIPTFGGSFMTSSGQLVSSHTNGGKNFVITQMPQVLSVHFDQSEALRALSLDESNVAGGIYVGSAGSPKLMVPVTNREIVDSLEPNSALLQDWSVNYGINGAYVYSQNRSTSHGSYYARSFNPTSGSKEDAATGSAAIILGGVGPFQSIVIEQGRKMGRPSEIHVEKSPGGMMLGGHVQQVKQAEMEKE